MAAHIVTTCDDVCAHFEGKDCFRACERMSVCLKLSGCVRAYLAALAGNAAVVVTCGLVTTHHTWLILFEVAGDVP